jgi:hypothetical protein
MKRREIITLFGSGGGVPCQGECAAGQKPIRIGLLPFGQGSTFAFTLPVRVEQQAEPA